MRKMTFFFMFVIALMVMPSAFASGSVTGNNLTCPSGYGSLGGVDISWTSSGETESIAVYVIPSGGSWTLFGGGDSGTNDPADWLEYKTSYTFQMYAGLTMSYGFQSGSYAVSGAYFAFSC
jgi:hypothetical protein